MERELNFNGDGVIDGVVFRGGLPDDPTIAEAFAAPRLRRRRATVPETPINSGTTPASVTVRSR
jgi:hypothetical protein